MPDPINITQIPAPRVELIDPRSGLMSREWFRFFNNIYTIVGANLGVIQIPNGGTGLSSYPSDGQLLIGSTVGEKYVLNTLTAGLGIGVTNGAGTISIANAGVLSFSGGTTGLTPSISTTGAITLAGVLKTTNGGTGQITYTNGQLLIGNTTGNTLTKSTLTAGSGITIANGAGAITLANTGVLSFSGGTTGLTPATATTGAVTLAGTLDVDNGGTGLTTGYNLAKAWISLYDNGTTVATLKSFNVSSVTRNATCDWTINFTTAMADANYSIVGSGGWNSTSMRSISIPYNLGTNLTTSVRVQCVDSDAVIAPNAWASIAIFD